MKIYRNTFPTNLTQTVQKIKPELNQKKESDKHIYRDRSLWFSMNYLFYGEGLRGLSVENQPGSSFAQHFQPNFQGQPSGGTIKIITILLTPSPSAVCGNVKKYINNFM